MQVPKRMSGETAAWGMRGMAVAPHALAAQSAVAVLREAIESGVDHMAEMRKMRLLLESLL